MANQAHKRADGRAAKSPSGRAITDHADCCDCQGGGGGDCCLRWLESQCDLGSVVAPRLRMQGSFRIGGRFEQDTGGGLRARDNVNLTTRTFDQTVIGPIPACNSVGSQFWDIPSTISYVRVWVNWGHIFSTLGGILLAPASDDFWSQGLPGGMTTPSRWLVDMLTDYSGRIPFLSASYQGGLTRPPEVAGEYGGYLFVSDRREDPFSAEPGENRLTQGGVFVSRGQCVVTATMSFSSFREILGYLGQQVVSRRTSTQDFNATLTMTFGSCAGGNGLRGPGGSMVDPAVDAMVRGYGGCKGCGDGNPMA